MFGSHKGSAKHIGLIQLKETSSKSVVASQNFQFTANGEPQFYDQLFSSPASVMAGVKYTVTVEYNTTQTIHGISGDGLSTASAACHGVTVNFVFYDTPQDVLGGSNNGSSKNVGQIPRILFSF